MAKLGKTGPEVGAIGLGCMGMSGMYGATDDEESVRTIQAAIDQGITLIDTGDFYGQGHNETLIGRAIRGRRADVVLSVKYGALRGPDGSFVGVDTRPAATKNFLGYSLKRLGVDVIDVYRPARLDPAVPIEETMGGLADLVRAGYVKHVALSEVGVDTIRRAHAVHPVVDLQIEYSVATRGPEAKIFPALDELGIGATLYGVFSRGLLTGGRPQGSGDYRAHLPRFTGSAGERNAAVVARFTELARAGGRSPAELALAWVLRARPSFVPVVGVKTRAQLAELTAVRERPLGAADAAAVEALFAESAIEGERYQPAQMRALDSER